MDEPKAVENGTLLVPWVSRDDISCITVHRILIEGDGDDMREIPSALPVRFGPDDDEVSIGADWGGGLYLAQARDKHGRYIKGAPGRRFVIDGPPKDGPTAAPPSETRAPPAPPSVPAPPAAGVASLGVAVGSPLSGMPAFALDQPGLTPESRAFVHLGLTMLAYQRDAYATALDRVTDAARDSVTGEREAMKAAVDVATSYVEKVGGVRAAAEGEGIRALADVMKLREEQVRAMREEHAETLRRLAATETELARARTLLEVGGQVGGRGALDVVEAILSLAIKTFGPGFVGLVAEQLGVSPDRLEAFTRERKPSQNAAQ